MKKIYDVSFVGQCYGKRPELIEQLRTKGIHVHTFGHGWPTSGRVSQSNLIKIYNQSKIVFNSYLSSKNTMRMNARDFEVLGCGSLPIANDIEELKEFFVPGKEILTYHDIDEAARKIKYYLLHEEERNFLTDTGCKRVLRDHTYEKRFQEIFRFAEQIKK